MKIPKLPTTRVRRSPFNALEGTLDREARTVEAVVATSEWIDGPLGPERLLMTAQAVDLSRAVPSVPLHDDHGPQYGGSLTGARIGVAENLRVSNGKLKARLRFSRNEGGSAALQDIEDKIITHVSVGYRVLDARPTKKGLLITRWAPHEVSTPSVVADRAAVIQRNATMPDDEYVDTTGHNTPIDQTLEYQAGIRAEQARTSAVNAAFDPFPNAGDLRTRALAEKWDVERVRTELLTFLGKDATPTGRGPDIVAGEDAMQKFVRGASEALCVRANIVIDPDTVKRPERIPVAIMSQAEAAKLTNQNPYLGYSLRELAREYLRVAGDSVRGDAKTLVGQAFTRAAIIGHSTSDFANLLVDAANKALQLGYEEAPETWEVWTKPGTLPDFKVGHRPKLSTFSDLDEVPESGEVKYGTFSDFKETIQLAEYSKLFTITRRAIINDDLGAFTDAPRAMARAASRNVGDLVYAILSNNGAMSDGNALFSAAHSNYVAGGSGAAPSVTTLNAAYASMARQTDPGGATLNVTPTFIVAGHTLRGTIDALLASSLNPAQGAITSFMQANIWQARLTPVYDARVDADDVAKWYLAAAKNAGETIETAFLNGVRTPRLEREETITVSGVVMRVSHDVGVSPLDWRFLYHNDGD